MRTTILLAAITFPLAAFGAEKVIAPAIPYRTSTNAVRLVNYPSGLPLFARSYTNINRPIDYRVAEEAAERINSEAVNRHRLKWEAQVKSGGPNLSPAFQNSVLER